MKSASRILVLTLLIVGGFRIVTAQAPKNEASRPSMPERVQIVYWANQEEYAAYCYLVEYFKQSGVTCRVDTAEYTPTNFFQVQMAPVFKNWVDTRKTVEKDKIVRSLSSQMQTLGDKDLMMLRNMIQSMARTNTGPEITTMPGELLTKP